MSKRITIKDNKFYFSDKQIFLCGALPFDLDPKKRGNYFGNDRYKITKDELIAELDVISKNGGNYVFIDIHRFGEHTPEFDSAGNVVRTDGTGSLPSDMKSYMDEAQKRNVFVLWQFASWLRPECNITMKIVHDPAKIQGYIDNCLLPIVKHLSGHPALLGYNVFWEPEFNLDVLGSTEKGFEADYLAEKWPTVHVNTHVPVKGYTMAVCLRYINMLADAIHSTDPGALVSVMPRAPTTWNRNSEIHFTKDYYSDEMLLQAGGRKKGYLDFLAAREKPWGTADDGSFYFVQLNMLMNKAEKYHQTKPILIGPLVFRQLPKGYTCLDAFRHAYTSGYAGISLCDLRNKDEEPLIAETLSNFKNSQVYDRSNGIIEVDISSL